MSGAARHVRKNRRDWDRESDEYQRLHAPQLNRWDRPGWGTHSIPESKLSVLGDVSGQDVLEYGCGGGQWSIALARLGARPVGMDLSIRQLAHALAHMQEASVSFPLVNADAERTPFANQSFDVVFSDHGAMSFAEPDRTVAEVVRLLRPGGLFAFNIESAFHFVCWNDDKETVDEQLHVDYFGMRTWEDDRSVNFQLPYGEWIRLFRRNGLQVEDLIELRPSSSDRTTYAEFAPLHWARRWPAENIWKLRKVG
jgi:SAM-dependent methyltransferase